MRGVLAVRASLVAGGLHNVCGALLLHLVQIARAGRPLLTMQRGPSPDSQCLPRVEFKHAAVLTKTGNSSGH